MTRRSWPPGGSRAGRNPSTCLPMPSHIRIEETCRALPRHTSPDRRSHCTIGHGSRCRRRHGGCSSGGTTRTDPSSLTPHPPRSAHPTVTGASPKKAKVQGRGQPVTNGIRSQRGRKSVASLGQKRSTNRAQGRDARSRSSSRVDGASCTKRVTPRNSLDDSQTA